MSLRKAFVWEESNDEVAYKDKERKNWLTLVMDGMTGVCMYVCMYLFIECDGFVKCDKSASRERYVCVEWKIILYRSHERF